MCVVSFRRLKERYLDFCPSKITTSHKKARPELVNARGVGSHCPNLPKHMPSALWEKLRKLVWGILMYPLYSPDLAPFRYDLFRYLRNSLNDVDLTLMEEVRKLLLDVFHR